MSVSPSLTGTLQGGYDPNSADVLTQMQALAQQQQAALAASTQAANQAASDAAQNYQQAAAAPAPTPDALSTLLTTLGGNVASILGGQPSYRENAQQTVQQNKAQLLKQRADNLQALQDVYQQKANEAQKAGDLEQTEKYRRQYEVLSKQLEIVNANAARAAQEKRDADRFKAAQDLQAQRDAAAEGRLNQRLASAGTAGAGNPADLTNSLTTRQLPDGSTVQYLNASPTQYPLVKERQAAATAAKNAKIPVLGDREQNVLDQIDSVRGDIADVVQNVVPKLPTSGGVNRLVGGGINQAKAALQTDPTLAGYPAFRTAAIKTIQTLASLGKGLRINQAEIQAAQNFDFPKITDSQPVAQEKLRILSMMMEHLENAALGRTVPNAASLEVLKAVRNLNAGNLPAPAAPTKASVPVAAAPKAKVETIHIIGPADATGKRPSGTVPKGTKLPDGWKVG